MLTPDQQVARMRQDPAAEYFLYGVPTSDLWLAMALAPVLALLGVVAELLWYLDWLNLSAYRYAFLWPWIMPLFTILMLWQTWHHIQLYRRRKSGADTSVILTPTHLALPPTMAGASWLVLELGKIQRLGEEQGRSHRYIVPHTGEDHDLKPCIAYFLEPDGLRRFRERLAFRLEARDEVADEADFEAEQDMARVANPQNPEIPYG